MRDGYVDVEHWVTISLMPWVLNDDPKEWVVTGIQTQHVYRGAGWAARLLDQVLADADAEGVTLLLQVMPDHTGLSFDTLVAFYQRRGFTWNDEAGPSGMVRLPRTGLHGVGRRIGEPDDQSFQVRS